MSFRLRAAATLACVLVGACHQSASAQFGNLPTFGRPQPAGYPQPAANRSQPAANRPQQQQQQVGAPQAAAFNRPAAANRNASAAAYYQPTPAEKSLTQTPGGGQSQMRSQGGGATSTMEALPDGPSSGMPSSMEGYPSMESSGGYYNEGFDGYGMSGDSCCDNCGGPSGACSCICPPGMNLCGDVCKNGQWFFTADYLYVRSSFSEAIAYLTQDTNTQNLGRDDFTSLDFQYESSYRVGGGYRLCGCGDEVRFMFTNLSSNAFTTAPEGSFVPYEAAAPPDGRTDIYGNVNVKSYDVEFAKRIPLCMQQCGGCGDCCDPCGQGCANPCPMWELTWSGGVRFADVGWQRQYIAIDDQEEIATNANATMSFRGGGPRVGLEGRRYFCNSMFSMYAKGNISLLLGDVNITSHRVVDGGSTPDVENFQTIRNRQIIPVTEIEAGMTGQVTKCTTLSAGYLFSGWHDLGFRDQFNFPTLLETSYDDANILGFDGFFARAEFAF